MTKKVIDDKSETSFYKKFKKNASFQLTAQKQSNGTAVFGGKRAC